MNSIERIQATLEGKPTDRRALSLVLSLYGAKLTNCPLSEYYTDPIAYARGQSAVLETFEPDILFGPFALSLEGEAFGSQVRFFDNQPPNLVRPVIDSADEIDRLAIPDIDSHPKLLYFRKAIQTMVEEHGQRCPIAGIALSPLALPAMIMSMGSWLQTVLFDKDGTKRMLELAVPHFVRWVNALFRDGVSCVVIPAGLTNSSIITRQIAVDVAIPVLKEAFSQVNGPLVVHHVGTPLAPFIDLFADLPNVYGFVLDDRDDFTQIRQKVGPEFTLIGNIETVKLHERKPEEVVAECRKLLHDRRDDPRFILGTSGSDISFDTPVENILAFRQAAESFANV